MSESTEPLAKPNEPEDVTLKSLTADKAGVLHPADSVKTAGDRMREHDADTWPVAEDRKLVGMVDEKNPDWQIGGRGHDPKSWQVGQIMSREVIFCYEDEDCASAQKMMDEHDLGFLPVVDRQMRIVGIFSRAEIEEKAQTHGTAVAIEEADPRVREAGANETTRDS
jgi:CBS domain-containing protein